MAKIETFTEDFDDLTSWVDYYPSSPFASAGDPGSFVASGGRGVATLPVSTQPDPADNTIVFYNSASTYSLYDSWVSMDVVDYANVDASSVGTYSMIGGIYPNGSTIGMYMIYDRAGDGINFLNYAFASMGSIPNPGVPVKLGLSFGADFFLTYSYSLDDGVTWVDLGSYDLTAFSGSGLWESTDWSAFVGLIALKHTAPVTMEVDNYNLSEPPGSPAGPISEPVSVGNVVVTAKLPYMMTAGNVIHIAPDVKSSVAVTAIPHTANVFGMLVDVPSSEVDVTALPHTGISYGPFYVTFAPANVSVVSPAAVDISMGVEAPSINVVPEPVNVTILSIDPVVGSFLPGDPFAAPVSLSGLSGSAASTDMTSYTMETDEVVPAYTTKTKWFRFNAPSPGVLSVTALNTTGLGTYSVQILDADSVSSLSELAFANGEQNGYDYSLPISLSSDVITGPVYVRLNTNEPPTDIALSWSFAPSLSQLLVDPLTPVLERTPEDLQLAVQGGNPGETMRFTWNPPVTDLIPDGLGRPIVLGEITADSEGNIFIGTLEIPSAYAGTYTVDVLGLSSNKRGSVSFSIANSPLPQDIVSSPSEPVAQLGTDWLWDDGRGHTWVMPKNPDRMKTVVVPKVLTAEHTTAGNGQHIVWQGATPAVQWGFNGTVTTRAEYNQLEFYYSLNRKFWITDHKNNRWVVTFTNLQVTPRRAGDNFWVYDYEAELLLFPYDPVYKKTDSKWKVNHL